MKFTINEACKRILADRIESLKHQLHDLIEGAKNDSKSTAGDKHETARAMMQLEQEKLGNQLKILEAQQQILQRLDPNAQSENIVNGSLVQTDKGWIYLSIPLGKIRVDDVDVICVSPQSPLGVKLLGKMAGSTVEVNGISYRVQKIS